jgi:hypothetical protein
MPPTTKNKSKKERSCHQPPKMHMTYNSFICPITHLYVIHNLISILVTNMQLAFGLGFASYLNRMRFSRPSHNINVPIFPTLLRLVSYNHINNLDLLKMPLLLLSLTTGFTSVSSRYP